MTFILLYFSKKKEDSIKIKTKTKQNKKKTEKICSHLAAFGHHAFAILKRTNTVLSNLHSYIDYQVAMNILV